MAWFADLAGKAESLLNNLDEQTGVALRHHNVTKKRFDNNGINFGAQENPLITRRTTGFRSMKKAMPVQDMAKRSSPSRNSSPIANARTQMKDDILKNGSVKSKSKKFPSRKCSPQRQNNLDDGIKTLVGDYRDNENTVYNNHLGLKHRRLSLPEDLEVICNEEFTIRQENYEVENAMLKNELNVLNREVTELLERLHKTEDGNDVDSTELTAVSIKQKAAELQNEHLSLEKESLTTKVEMLSVKIEEHKIAEVAKYKDRNQRLEAEIAELQSKNSDLEEKCTTLKESAKASETVRSKLENDLRHAQSTVNDLQENLQKSADECKRLEKDWEAYKLRVKNMLQSKDTEIQKLQDGVNTTEDTKVLIEQMEHVKRERDELQDAVEMVRSECNDLKLYVQQVEARQSSAGRVVTALRDALREERASRNKAEDDAIAIAKEMKAIQMETCQTVANLRTALREKEEELLHIRDTSSVVPSSDSSALNVADYDTIDNNKVQHLTQLLVQKQTKIDSLLADSNILRIQLEKLESKYKAEVTSNRAKSLHSVIHLQESESRRSRAYNTPDTLSSLSVRLGLTVKRYPIFRVFVIGYMVCLHLLVLTVLFTRTPESYVSPSKS